MNEQSTPQPWQWEDEHWRKLVGHVSAGRTYRPQRWKDGARCARLAIEQEMGLLYDSSLMADEDCYELLLDGVPTGVVELPVEWVRDDAVYFTMHRFQSLRPHTPPREVLEIFRRELDVAYEAGGLCQRTMHPHVIGYRSRIFIVEEIIRHALAKGDVWFATHREVVEWAKANTA